MPRTIEGWPLCSVLIGSVVLPIPSSRVSWAQVETRRTVKEQVTSSLIILTSECAIIQTSFDHWIRAMLQSPIKIVLHLLVYRYYQRLFGLTSYQLHLISILLESNEANMQGSLGISSRGDNLVNKVDLLSPHCPGLSCTDLISSPGSRTLVMFRSEDRFMKGKSHLFSCMFRI